ncbi:MAG: hypothetical protein KatS3mg105_1254 [Gemmatales bacterium]|nr:MAG: hypothetical protein KatS3mg105_1254 [Gemmatales bacterium]
MKDILQQHYGKSEGPLGFPQTEKQARALNDVLKRIPKGDEFRYRKSVLVQPPTELLTGERADVSWISTEDPDRQNEVVVARGMNDSQFSLNPLVTLNHDYTAPPAGKSLWRRRVRDGDRVGIKAKTHFPPKPANWPEGKDWVPDIAFALVQADLLRGKSIGFLPLRVHAATAEERRRPGWERVELVIDEWLLLEYACVFLPAQQHAVVEQVSKSLRLAPDLLKTLGLNVDSGATIPHCRWQTIVQACTSAIDRLNWQRIIQNSIDAWLERERGRV